MIDSIIDNIIDSMMYLVIIDNIMIDNIMIDSIIDSIIDNIKIHTLYTYIHYIF
jgi:hypothetical protein